MSNPLKNNLWLGYSNQITNTQVINRHVIIFIIHHKKGCGALILILKNGHISPCALLQTCGRLCMLHSFLPACVTSMNKTLNRNHLIIFNGHTSKLHAHMKKTHHINSNITILFIHFAFSRT